MEAATPWRRTRRTFIVGPIIIAAIMGVFILLFVIVVFRLLVCLLVLLTARLLILRPL